MGSKTAGEPAQAVRFKAKVEQAGRRLLLRLPLQASQALPSRGQVAVQGTLDGRAFETVIEPDGYFGHWVSIDSKLASAISARPGREVEAEVTPSAAWPEPRIPADLKQALAGAPHATRELWRAITPMARWEWVRWVNETKNPKTRERRVEVSLSKLSQGKRRPCCFNLASCTDPELAKSGKLAV